MVPSLANDKKPTDAVIRENNLIDRSNLSQYQKRQYLYRKYLSQQMVLICNTLPKLLETERHSYQTKKAKKVLSRLAAKMMKNYGVSLSLPAPVFYEIKLIQHFD